MNYRKKKKLFQYFSFSRLQHDASFSMCFQTNSISSLNRILLIKEVNKLNLKLQTYPTKFLRQKKFIFEEKILKNVYSGFLFILSSYSTKYFDNMQTFLNLFKTFHFLIPIFFIFLKRVFFPTNLQNFLKISNVNSFLISVLFIRLCLVINILRLK